MTIKYSRSNINYRRVIVYSIAIVSLFLSRLLFLSPSPDFLTQTNIFGEQPFPNLLKL